MYYIFILVCMHICSLTYTQQDTPFANHIHIYANPTSTSSSIAHGDASAVQHQIATNKTYVENHTLLHTLTSSMHTALERMPSLWEQCTYECFNYKWHIVGGSIGLGYCIACALLIRDALYLNDTQLWSRWKFDTPLTSLCIMDQEALAKELIISIQERHLDTKNPTDCIRPLTHFISAIEYEKNRLETYCRRATWIKRLYLFKITPINDAKIALAHTLLERLQFVQTLFMTWASHYNWKTLV